MRVAQWVRLLTPASCGLRLGGWYRATALTAREAHVNVHGRLVKVPRSLLEVRVTPPAEWTVVRGPLPTGAGVRDGYLVCPSCRHRYPLPDTPLPTTRCARCNEVFPVAWNEPYPRSAGSGPAPHRAEPAPSAITLPLVRESLTADRRMTRRRSPVDRRRFTRRSAERRVLAFASVRLERRVAARRAGVNRRNDWDRRGRVDRRKRTAMW